MYKNSDKLVTRRRVGSDDTFTKHDYIDRQEESMVKMMSKIMGLDEDGTKELRKDLKSNK